jgi:hypothetical protein
MLNGDSLLSINHSGAIGSISWQSVPALLDAPAPLLARQWKKIFDQGKVAAPPMAVLSSAIFGYLAYRGMLAHVLDGDQKADHPRTHCIFWLQALHRRSYSGSQHHSLHRLPYVWHQQQAAREG